MNYIPSSSSSSSSSSSFGAGYMPPVPTAAFSGTMDQKMEVNTSSGDVLVIKPLGAGAEVGRSCVLLTFRGKSIMLDCGVHPGLYGRECLPYFGEIEEEGANIEAILISHFHLDHCAALPHFLKEVSRFRGKVYMTYPTEAIYKLVVADYIKVSNYHAKANLKIFDDVDLFNSYPRIQTINYHERVETETFKFWCYNAGHVLGASMFMIEVDGITVLYTGDYSRQEDRHLKSAEIPEIKPQVLIVESTYGEQNHEPKPKREARFKSDVRAVVERGGKCLIPVFALGRAQELLLILEELWESNPSLQTVPIYYASTLAQKCMEVYKTFINTMNDRIVDRATNPFQFKHIFDITSEGDFPQRPGPCVVIASPGMLQNGTSRKLFDQWCGDPKNGVIFTGYSVENTHARNVLKNPQFVKTLEDPNGSPSISVPLKMSISNISFSAHSDFEGTSTFIDILNPPHIVLVHGERNEMSRLMDALLKKYDGLDHITIYKPENCTAVDIPVPFKKIAKMVGKMSGKEPRETFSGLIALSHHKYYVSSSDEMSRQVPVVISNVNQTLNLRFSQSFDLLEKCLRSIYDGVERLSSSTPSLKIYDEVKVSEVGGDKVRVEWRSNPVNDTLADSVTSMVLQIEANPFTNRFLHGCCHSDQLDTFNIISKLLAKQFSLSFPDELAQTIRVELDDSFAIYHHKSGETETENEDLRQQIEGVVQTVLSVLEPVHLS